jgi:hypothetical protein
LPATLLHEQRQTKEQLHTKNEGFFCCVLSFLHLPMNSILRWFEMNLM